MKFIKFPSLNNTNSARTISRMENSGLTGSSHQWMVTEKIHGANVGIYSDGEQVKFASREKFVEGFDRFYNGRRVVSENAENIKNIAKDYINSLNFAVSNNLGEDVKGKPFVIVYGELFGGSVQKKMPYQEKQKFCAFDLVMVLDISNKDLLDSLGKTYHIGSTIVSDCGTKILLTSANKLKLFEEFKVNGILTAPLLNIGSFYDCLNFSNEFESNFTDHEFVDSLNLSSEFRSLRCKAEGIVIEPVSSAFISQQRVYLKKRSIKFEEKVREPKKNLNEKLLETLSPKAVFVLENIEERICENRFNSVVSKIGEVEIKDFNKVSGLLLQDALEDFEKDELYDMDTDTVVKTSEYLDKAELKAVSKIALFSIGNLVRPLLLAK